MAICTKCGVDLSVKGHRNNCPLKTRTGPPTDNSSLVINPAAQNDLTTNEVDDVGGGTATIDPPKDSGGMAGGAMDAFGSSD